jgi:2-polyprenyl-6-hydroxyphenyl methylase/3-demethylubiquinone-9 3-methyltransferase
LNPPAEENNLTNIDYEEIGKFDKMSERWWDLKGEMKSLHDINPLRVGYIGGRKRLRGADVVDVGCGGGILSEALARRGARVTGIDMAQGPLKVAEEHLRISGLEIGYFRSTAEQWAEINPAAYDAAVCMELLEHVPDPGSIVASCARLVKPGGDIFFATLNRTPKAFLLAILGAEYILGFLPRNTHRFEKFVKPEEMSRYAEAAKLLKMNFTGMHYNILKRQYWLGGDLRVNYLMHFKRPFFGSFTGYIPLEGSIPL